MMKHEFEELAGYEVSTESYNNIIEPMYMASNMTKQEFVKVLNPKAFALPTKKQMVNQMRKLAAHLHETCERYTDYEAQQELDKLSKEYARRFYGINWSQDITAFVYTIDEYFYELIGRGATYPKTLVIGRGGHECERIALVK